MSLSWAPARILTGVGFLGFVILFVPLAFDVGGRDCGLLYSLLLAAFYFLLSTARGGIPSTTRWRGARILLGCVEMLQCVVILGLLVYALNKADDDGGGGGGSGGLGFEARERLLGVDGGHAAERSAMDRLTIGAWDTFLTFSTPMFQLSEGFCSLLVIQAGGQISRWLVNRKKADTWMVRAKLR